MNNLQNENKRARATELEIAAPMEHGTIEIGTTRLLLRRYQTEDAEILYRDFGSDPVMYQYSGWNPYATPEMAEATVREFMEQYDNPQSGGSGNGHPFYGWAIEHQGALVGTVGAYDATDDSIEVGMSISRSAWGQGFATEALQAVIRYLTGQEGFVVVKAWCAADNIGSLRAMEKSGMRRVDTVTGGLEVEGDTYDQLIYEYQKDDK